MEFLKKYKKEIIRISLFFLVMIVFSFVLLGILMLANVINYDKGFVFNIDLFASLKDSFWVYIVFIVLQVVVTTILCFAPGTTAMFIALGIALFGSNFKCFGILYIGVILSSISMDLIGRFGGSKLIKWLIGEKAYDSALSLIKEKGSVYLPFMYLLPVFPDDALCMVAGMIKIKLPLHILYICLCRGIGIATIVFGFNLIPFDTFTSVYDYFVLVACILVYVFILFKFARYIDKLATKFLNKRTKKTSNDSNNKSLDADK